MFAAEEDQSDIQQNLLHFKMLAQLNEARARDYSYIFTRRNQLTRVYIEYVFQSLRDI